MNKRENLQKQIQLSEQKIQALRENQLQLKEKLSRINEQIVFNEKKIQQIEFFQEKTQKIIDSLSGTK